MKNLSVKVLSLLLAGLMALSCFVACGESSEGEGADSGTQAAGAESEGETLDPAEAEMNALGEIDFGGESFAIMYQDTYKSEIWGENKTVDAEGGEDQVINDAVYERNSLLEDRCNLVFDHIPVSAAEVTATVLQEATTATGDFFLIASNAKEAASHASSGYLYDYVELGVDLDQPWWDGGTADFALDGKVFFMNGAVNFADDNVTYVLIFNKKLQAEHANTVPDPYETVLNWEWTLDYFNTVIQGVSADNGDGAWNENDTYGFITTWEYGNTFFMGSDLRYIINDRDSVEPTLFLTDGKMDKALSVLETAQSIYHDNNATYMSPPGQEPLGLEAFKDNRGLFYGEVAQYLKTLNREMEGDYGVLPVPKYDKAQEFYRTWTHESGSTLSVTAAVKDPDTIGQIITAYAILSYQKVKPAYYDVMLTSKSVRDPQSPVMLDIIFQNRVYDMAMYYSTQFGDYYTLFKTAVNDDSDSFSSKYASVSRKFDNAVDKFLRKLNNKK